MNTSFSFDPNRAPISHFCLMDADTLLQMRTELQLTLTVRDLQTCQRYFMARERRDPTMGELTFLDKLAQHAQAQVQDRPCEEISAEEAPLRAFADICRMREAQGKQTPPSLSDMLDCCAQYLARAGLHPHTDKLYAGNDAHLAAHAGGYPPRLVLSLPHSAAAVMQSAPAPLPRQAVLLRLLPTGNEPFANEIARFLQQHRRRKLHPLAVTGQEGILPHLLDLPGLVLNTATLHAYDPAKGPASIFACTEPSFLFLAPKKHLYALFESRVPLFHLGELKKDGICLLHHASLPQLSVELRLLRTLFRAQPIKAALSAPARTDAVATFVQNGGEGLYGIESASLDESDLLAFFKEATARGADLKRATASLVLTLPHEAPDTCVQAALPAVLATHRTLAELTLPVIHPKTQFADVHSPHLSLFLHAPLGTPRATDDVTDMPALRALFWDK